MIRRGNELAQAYERALDVWYRNEDPAKEDSLGRILSRSLRPDLLHRLTRNLGCNLRHF